MVKYTSNLSNKSKIPITSYSKTCSCHITHAKHTSILANNGRYRSNGRKKRSDVGETVVQALTIATMFLTPLAQLGFTALAGK